MPTFRVLFPPKRHLAQRRLYCSGGGGGIRGWTGRNDDSAPTNMRYSSMVIQQPRVWLQANSFGRSTWPKFGWRGLLGKNPSNFSRQHLGHNQQHLPTYSKSTFRGHPITTNRFGWCGMKGRRTDGGVEGVGMQWMREWPLGAVEGHGIPW